MSLFDRNEWLADYENRYEAYMSKHIENCIKMLKTKEYGRQRIERFEVELNRRTRFKRDPKRALEELREENELPEFEQDDWGD